MGLTAHNFRLCERLASRAVRLGRSFLSSQLEAFFAGDKGRRPLVPRPSLDKFAVAMIIRPFIPNSALHEHYSDYSACRLVHQARWGNNGYRFSC